MPIPAHYRETIVTPQASRHIEAYWSFSATETGETLVLPDGRCDIIMRFNLHSTDSPMPIITGPGTQAYSVTYKPGDCWLGLRLRPSNGHLLWQKNISNATNQVLQGRDAIAQLSELSNLEELDKENLTQKNFARILNCAKLFSPTEVSNDRIERAVDLLHVTGGRLSIDELAASVNCSSRHLNRLFHMTVGLPTKIYSQLVQFHRTLSLVHELKMPLNDAALEGGYSDQSHLTRSFKRFGGFAPARVPANLSIPSLF